MPFVHAKNLNGEIVDASAEKNESVCCMFCNAKMHLTHSRSGLAFYALNPGESHNEDICLTYVKAKKIPKIEKTDLPSFIDRLVNPPGGNRGGGGGEPGGGTVKPPKPDDPDYFETKAYTSLSELAKFGIVEWGKEYPIGNKKLSDFLSVYKWLDWNEVENSILGHIVEARLFSKSDEEKTVHFKIFAKKEFPFWNDVNIDYENVIFSAIFKKDEDYVDFVNHYFTAVKNDKNKTIYKAMPNKDFLLAVKWVYFPPDSCKKSCKFTNFCKNCKGLFVGIIYRKRQICEYISEKNVD